MRQTKRMTVPRRALRSFSLVLAVLVAQLGIMLAGEGIGGGGSFGAQARLSEDCGENIPAHKAVEKTRKMFDGYAKASRAFGYTEDPYWQHWESIFTANIAYFSSRKCINRDRFEKYQADMRKPLWLGLINFSTLKSVLRAAKPARKMFPNDARMLRTMPINGSVPGEGQPAKPRFLTSWAEAEQALADAAKYRFFPFNSKPERSYVIGEVTIDTSALHHERADAGFDVRQAELDLNSAKTILVEAKRRHERALPGFEREMEALDAEAEKTNQRFENIFAREQVKRGAGGGARQPRKIATRIAALEARNATIASRIAYLHNEDPADAGTRKTRNADLTAEADANAKEIARLQQAKIDSVKPVRTDEQERTVRRALEARNLALRDISRRRAAALRELERDRGPLERAREALLKSEETHAAAEDRYRQVHERPRLPIAEIKTEHYQRTYVGFRPRLAEINRKIVELSQLEVKARRRREEARRLMLDAGLSADVAALAFARQAGMSYMAQFGVEALDALYSATKDVAKHRSLGFIAKSFLYTIPSKIVFPPSYYDGHEPTLANYRAGEHAAPLWREMIGASLSEAAAKGGKAVGKGFAKTGWKYPISGALKYAEKQALEKALHEAMDAYLHAPDLGNIGQIRSDLTKLNEKTKAFKDFFGKNGAKNLAKSFGRELGKELAKSVLKEAIKRKLAHMITDGAWADYMAGQIELANAVALFRATRGPLDRAEAALAELQEIRDKLVSRYDANAKALVERNGHFFPAGGYGFSIILAENDAIRRASFRARVTLGGIALVRTDDRDGQPRFVVPESASEAFKDPDLPEALPLVITFERLSTAPMAQ